MQTGIKQNNGRTRIMHKLQFCSSFNERETSPALGSFLNEQKCKNITKNKT